MSRTSRLTLLGRWLPPLLAGIVVVAAFGAPAERVIAESVCEPPTVPFPSDPDERRRFFREPLAAAELWNPSGPRRVGLQAGHWLLGQAPPELGSLGAGASGGGKQEWEVNLDIARRVATLLEAEGIIVDVLPTAVPMRYRAHVFVSIHADGDPVGRMSGFKIARPGFSSVPEADDRLVDRLNDAYGPATGLGRHDDQITVRMRYYYAFNSRRFCHAVAPGVPQAIVETGFLTSAADRQLLLGNPDASARGIARGILAFLNDLPQAPGFGTVSPLPASPLVQEDGAGVRFPRYGSEMARPLPN